MDLSRANVALLLTRRCQIGACLEKKAMSLTKAERAATARKKKRAGAKGQKVVANTPRAKVRSGKKS